MNQFFIPYQHLLRSFRSPIHGMQTIPTLDWIILTIFFTTSAAIAGMLDGLIRGSWIDIFLGLVLLPINALVLNTFFIAWIIFGFALLHQRYLSWHRMAEIAVFSAMPYLILKPLYAWIPFIDLIGIAAQCFLLIKGVALNFHVSHRQVMKLVSVMYAVFFVFWALQKWLAQSA